MILGLRTAIYPAPDLGAAKRWYAELLGVAPYFDEPFYVGFNVAGYEMGLDPDLSTSTPGAGGAVAYWGVADLAAALERLAKDDVEIAAPLQDVGDGIRVATVRDPFGNLIGLIENPHFALPPA